MEESSVEVGDDFEEIWQSDDEGLRRAVEFDDNAEFRRHDELQGVRRGIEFGLGEGHEAPIVAPAVVEQFFHQRRFAGLQPRKVERPQLEPVAPFLSSGDGRRRAAQRLVDGIAIGNQVLRLLVAERLDMA